MRIESVRIQNFGPIRQVTINCRNLTSLVGPNGAGKSSILRAFREFFSGDTRATLDDVHRRDPSLEIEIAVTFSDLDDHERSVLESYVIGDKVTISKIISFNDGSDEARSAYHGHRRRNPEFDNAKRAPNAEEAVKQYRALRATEKYSSLPVQSSRRGAMEALETWEKENPGACEVARDEGQTFGITKGIIRLRDLVDFVFVPAVHDTAEEARKGGAIFQLVARASEPSFSTREVTDIRDKARLALQGAIDTKKNSELAEVTAAINRDLDDFAPGSGMVVEWSDPNISVDPPLPTISLKEDDFIARVEKSGNGVQRALMIAALPQLGERTSPKATPKPLILIIEEPELFQHPDRQRHLHRVLVDLASSEREGRRVQVILATHSPLFVNLDYFDCVRRVTKSTGGAPGMRETQVIEASLELLKDRLVQIEQRPPGSFTEESTRARLRSIMTPWMNEGFFARVVVLVEGESDRAALLAFARARGHNPEKLGISIIPTGGKENLNRPFLVFRLLGIPTYMIWDSDFIEEIPAVTDPEVRRRREKRDEAIARNRRLLRTAEESEVDFPFGVTSRRAVHQVDLETTLRTEFGEEYYRKAIEDAASYYGVKTGEAEKSPQAMERVVNNLLTMGRTSPFMDAVLNYIIELCKGSPLR